MTQRILESDHPGDPAGGARRPISRRRFLEAVGVGAAAGAASATAAGAVPARAAAVHAQPAPDVVVVGAGVFGIWTALHLQRLGARVRVLDAYGAGNSRQTSGGETRGVRTSYGDRPHGRQWAAWARTAIQRWTAWDDAWRDRLLPQLFFRTGDLILRERETPYLVETRAHWDALGTPYEVLTPDEVAYRWPWIRFDGLGAALYEPDAGVVRARRAIESVARVFAEEGGTIEIDRVSVGARAGGSRPAIRRASGAALAAGIVVFACGPWFPTLFPALLRRRIQVPMGHVFYFATPPGDTRFTWPRMPSYGVPRCTGWPALPPDHRGFRVRTGGQPPDDPDTSDRWIAPDYHARPREILTRHFPDLAGAPINETRSCHYELTVDRNFIVDTHPDFDDVWLAGGGSAEAFKFGPVLGEYIAHRVLGDDREPALADGFRLTEAEFGAPPDPADRPEARRPAAGEAAGQPPDR